jgi:hypothetical protein
MLKRLQDVVNNTEGVILVLTDADIATLLELKAKGLDDDINTFLEEKLKPILM